MGCVQSKQKPFRKGRTADEEVAAARLLAQQQVFAAQKAANNAPPPPPRPETEVMRRATAFDRLHEEAHKEPSLKDVKVVMGNKSQKLLEGFEQKEAAARAVPKLNDVKSTDINVRNSKLFDKLQQYEENDAKVRREPKLEKTFSQREKEKLELKQIDLSSGIPPAPQTLSGMTAVPRAVRSR